MGYYHFLRFIKDDLIDPNIAFLQNVDNFLFSIYFDYLERYDSDIKEERNNLLILVFRYVKELTMMRDEDSDVSYIKEKILKIEDEEKRKDCLSKIDYIDECINSYFFGLEKLIDLRYSNRPFNYAELEVDLLLYCILVSGLNKTKGEKFDHIKKRMKPLTEKLKEKFCEFGKHEIHKKRTFIFSLRAPLGTHANFYIYNYKDDLLRKFAKSDERIRKYNSDEDYDDEQDEIRSMFLTTNKGKIPSPLHLLPPIPISEELRFLDMIDKDACIEDYVLHAGREEIKIV